MKKAMSTGTRGKEVLIVSRDVDFQSKLEAGCGTGVRLKYFSNFQDVFINSNEHDVRVAIIDAAPRLELSLAKPLLKFTKRLHESGYKIVYISSNPTSEREIEIRQIGVHFFLPRSVPADIILKVISKLLDHETSRIE